MKSFLVAVLLIYRSCYITTAEIEDRYDLSPKNVSDKQDFDFLIFSQRWPATTCKIWKSHCHKCYVPRTVDAWKIYGIWPSKLGDVSPTFCNRTWFFDSEQVMPIKNQLESVWTTIFEGSSLPTLWAHEWTKYGTCAASLNTFDSEYKYFSVGMEWLHQYSMSEILQSKNIIPSNTQKYTIVSINNAIKDKLGVDPMIECRKHGGKNYLSEIRICFTKDLNITHCIGDKECVDIDDQSIMTNCDKTMEITYPHYSKNTSWIVTVGTLFPFLSWFTF